MPVGDKQKLITSIVSKVLNEEAQLDKKFPWFINQHQIQHFKDSFSIIDKIYLDLKGNTFGKRVSQLQCDAYFGGKYNFIFEFDEFQHFSTARLVSLNTYPVNLKLNYNISDWKNYCTKHSNKADKYRFNKTTTDFNFSGGRTSQRAYLDCFRDVLPQHNGLNPTLRISDFEVLNINNNGLNEIKAIETLLKNKLKYL